MPNGLGDWLDYLERLHPKAIALGLERVCEVRERLAATVAFPIVTVTGTNGKGSTCAMLEAILDCAGYRVACYTSPHLLRYNERVRVARRAVSDADLCRAFEAVEVARQDVPLTYFEFGTLAAMWLFCASPVDVAVLEVGLGGRLDAVNAFDPDCAVLTGVAIDHVDYLGPDRESIGREKAGIFRPGRPALYGRSSGIPDSVVAHAEAIGADLRIAGRDFSHRDFGRQWDFIGRRQNRYGLPHPALRGIYQLDNAALALAALETLQDRFPVGANQVKRGLLEVDLPGRLQVVPGQPVTVLDVAHNPDAAESLAAALRAMGRFGKTRAVFAMLSDKDIGGVAAHLAPLVDRWYVAPLPGPRGASSERIRSELAGAAPDAEVEVFASVDEAWRHAREASALDDRILVFGSFLTVARILSLTDPGRTAQRS